jgi:peptidoglycan hydrolase-like protein with peptidoglycan-binding domain
MAAGVFRPLMPRVACALLTIALVVALLADATRADARSRAPQLAGARCVPSSAVGCRAGVKVKIGAQVQLRGTRLVSGMRVTFRWPRGALATRLKRSKVGWVARVPAGTGLGQVNVTVRDRAGRRSRAVKIAVLPAPVPRNRPLLSRGPLPAAFSGTGMWIWYMTRSEGGDPAAIAARARAAGVSTVFVKSSDGVDDWDQFEPGLVSLLHAQGLRVCAWQFVYGNDPEGEARLGAAAAVDGADCLVIDAETRYEGKYAQAQRYVTTLRSIVGAGYPVGLTSFPYVDYHGRFPYSVFLGAGGAQANLPQIYWKDISGSVDAVSAHTLAVNRVYGVPIAPLGQTSGGVPSADVQRFRAVWSGYGAGGLSWWSWQTTPAALWSTLATDTGPPVVVTDPGWPTLGKGAKGDLVVWLQQHLVSADPSVPVDGSLATLTVTALRNFQLARGIPPTGTTDAATWAAVLALPMAAKDWTAP